MRIATAAGMMLLIVNLHAADQVVVYVDNDIVVDKMTLCRAEGLASRMFARIGVSVRWHAGTPPRGDTAAMVVSLFAMCRAISILTLLGTPRYPPTPRLGSSCSWTGCGG